MSFLVFYLGILLVGKAQRPASDLITNLPGLDFATNYSQYSGFLDLNNGHHYFYWLTESQSNRDKDPLVLWLNGGPGCSSLYGLFYELGPIHVDTNGSLYDTSKYAWNKNANIIYLESPICVGFSYIDNATHCNMNDTSTADDNYHAILKFLDKFPVYKETDFFVIGESYGGVYVPTLTLRILEGNADQDGEDNAKINIKGFGVGNGVVKREDNINSKVWFQYHHGMISEEIWNNIQTNCCVSPYNRYSCNFVNSTSTKCTSTLQDAQNNCCHDINPYDILDQCVYKNKNIFPNRMLKQEVIFNKFDDLRLRVDTCDEEDVGAEIYLNRMDVRNAIHIPSRLDNLRWESCADLDTTLNYTKVWYDLNPIYDDIFTLDKEIMMTMYNGDLDEMCNFLGCQWFIDDMNLSVVNEWREWFINNDNGKQVGGWTKDWDRGNGVHFATVRGAGHMVPLYKPQPALKLFQYFLQNKQLN